MGWALGQKRTLLGAGRRSAKCQERHYIPQQPAPLFDHLVGDVSVGALAAPTPCAQVCGPGPARFTSCSLGGRPALHQMSLTAWERNVMKISLLALLGLFVVVDASALLRAEESEKRTWRLTVEQNEPRLEYGTDNPEDTPIAFSCKARGGFVDVWINETGKGVKANRSMVAALTAGRTTSKVRGKTLTNEEAGSPSFQGAPPAKDPLLAALSKERTLVLVVGPSRDQVPLQEIGDKADRFSRLCQKKR